MSLSRLLGVVARAADWGESASEFASALSRRTFAALLELADDILDSCAGAAARVAEGVEGAAGLARARLRVEWALRLFVDDLLPGRHLLTCKVVAVGPLLASALLPGVQEGMASHLLSLASAGVPPTLLLLPDSGMLCLAAVQTYTRVRDCNPYVCRVAAFSLALSSAFYLAPVVITLPAEWFAHPDLVWPALQDIFVIPLQLVALYEKAGFGLSSAAPAVVFATMKTVAAVGMTVVSPRGNLCRLVGWSSFGLLALRLQEPKPVSVVAISDLSVGFGLISLLAQTLGVDDQIPLCLVAVCDAMSKVVLWHLLVQQDPGAARVEEEPMAEPPSRDDVTTCTVS